MYFAIFWFIFYLYIIIISHFMDIVSAVMVTEVFYMKAIASVELMAFVSKQAWTFDWKWSLMYGYVIPAAPTSDIL